MLTEGREPQPTWCAHTIQTMNFGQPSAVSCSDLIDAIDKHRLVNTSFQTLEVVLRLTPRLGRLGTHILSISYGKKQKNPAWGFADKRRRCL